MKCILIIAITKKKKDLVCVYMYIKDNNKSTKKKKEIIIRNYERKGRIETEQEERKRVWGMFMFILS